MEREQDLWTRNATCDPGWGSGPGGHRWNASKTCGLGIPRVTLDGALDQKEGTGGTRARPVD